MVFPYISDKTLLVKRPGAINSRLQVIHIKGLSIGKYCLSSYDEELVYTESCFIQNAAKL